MIGCAFAHPGESRGAYYTAEWVILHIVTGRRASEMRIAIVPSIVRLSYCHQPLISK